MLWSMWSESKIISTLAAAEKGQPQHQHQDKEEHEDQREEAEKK